MPKPQRVRDPIHDLIQFKGEGLEACCWDVVQTSPFQRLRRIKQLGFSEITFPGATHSRLAHSLGVFNTARQLTSVIKRFKEGAGFDSIAAEAAVAAALVHDIGHGPFSHAFETAATMAGFGVDHEDWTVRIIRETPVRDAFERVTPGFSDRVAKIIGSDEPTDIYCSVVSSQFDADRLDYSVETYLSLDDAVILGSLPLLQEAKMPIVAELANRLLNRSLFRCCDVTKRAAAWAHSQLPDDKDLEKRRDLARVVEARVRELVTERDLAKLLPDGPLLLKDDATRNPYKRVDSDGAALNRIWVKGEDKGTISQPFSR